MKFINSSKLRTFTLIEMLIVIVIIGILAAALVPRLQAVQGRARDTKRKADLAQIINGITIYKLDNGLYPKPRNSSVPTNDYNTNVYVSSRDPQLWISDLTGVVTSLPIDPRNTNIWYSLGGYEYNYTNVVKNGNAYALITRLENTNDPERCAVAVCQLYIVTSLYTFNAVACAGGVECGMLYVKSDLGP